MTDGGRARLPEESVPGEWGVGSGGVYAGHTVGIALSWKRCQLPGHLGPLMPIDEQAKKGVTPLVGIRDPEDHKEPWWIYVGSWKECVWNSRESLNSALGLRSLVIIRKGQEQRPNKGIW